MENIELKMDERIDEIASSGVKIIQSREVFSFSIDAILLARFPRLPKRGKIVDCAREMGQWVFLRALKPMHRSLS